MYKMYIFIPDMFLFVTQLRLLKKWQKW